MLLPDTMERLLDQKMRIIAGKFKSRRLKTLKGDNTRPTSDRTKEALFNAIGPYFDGGSFLDLFAGSGAMGLEAISRGMDYVSFVENNRNAQKIIQNNINELGLNNETEIIRQDALDVIKTLKRKYDIIFMDPPYDYKHIERIIDSISPLLKDDGYLIVETQKDIILEDNYNNLKRLSSKTYGFSKIDTYEMS